MRAYKREKNNSSQLTMTPCNICNTPLTVGEAGMGNTCIRCSTGTEDLPGTAERKKVEALLAEWNRNSDYLELKTMSVNYTGNIYTVIAYCMKGNREVKVMIKDGAKIIYNGDKHTDEGVNVYDYLITNQLIKINSRNEHQENNA